MAYSKNLIQRNKKLIISDENHLLHSSIVEVIMEYGFIILENNIENSGKRIRAVYDSYRIMNLVNNHLDKANAKNINQEEVKDGN